MVKRLMFELAGVTFTYGKSKNAYLNPATPLHIWRGIIFLSSENGDTIKSVVAFSFLPGGYRNNNNGNFNNMGNNGNFWSSTENNSNNAWNRNLNYNNTTVNRNNNNKQNGFSVRCVRDLEFKIISLFALLFFENIRLFGKRLSNIPKSSPWAHIRKLEEDNQCK